MKNSEVSLNKLIHKLLAWVRQLWPGILTRHLFWIEGLALLGFMVIGAWLLVRMFVLLPVVNEQSQTKQAEIDVKTLESLSSWSQARSNHTGEPEPEVTVGQDDEVE